MMTTKIIFDMFIKEIIKNTKISVYTVNNGIRVDMLCFYAYIMNHSETWQKEKIDERDIYSGSWGLSPSKKCINGKKITLGADYK